MGIGEVAAPQVDAYDPFTHAELGIKRAIKALVNVVCLCPKDLPGTSILGGGADLVNPAAM